MEEGDVGWRRATPGRSAMARTVTFSITNKSHAGDPLLPTVVPTTPELYTGCLLPHWPWGTSGDGGTSDWNLGLLCFLPFSSWFIYSFYLTAVTDCAHMGKKDQLLMIFMNFASASERGGTLKKYQSEQIAEGWGMAEMPTFSVCDTVADGNHLITQQDRFRVHLHQFLRHFTESQNGDSPFPLILPSKVSIHLPNFCPSYCDERLLWACQSKTCGQAVGDRRPKDTGGWTLVLQLLQNGRQVAVRLRAMPRERHLLQQGNVIGPCNLHNMGTNYTEIQASAGKTTLWC